MHRLILWRTGTTLAVVAGINYLVCTLIWMIWREPSLDFLNALFHGLDFRGLETPSSFSLSSFICAWLGLMIWFFVIGVIYVSVRNQLRPRTET